MKISRLFEIVYLLLDKKQITAGELAQHFEVSERTILRDIEALSLAGVPVYTSQGKGGGISILDSFVLNKTTISEEEQAQIIMALQSLAPTGHIDTDKITSKLGALFSKVDTSWIEVDFSRWGVRDADNDKFAKLKNAIIKKLAISFTYSNTRGEVSQRHVYPLKLAFKDKAWHVQSYCLTKNSYRTFKLNRIDDLLVLCESFEDKDFTVPPIEMPMLEEVLAEAPFIDLKMLFNANMAFRVYDDFDRRNVHKNSDGTFTVQVRWIDDPWLYSFLLSFGANVQVLQPQNVKDTLLAQAREIVKYYG